MQSVPAVSKQPKIGRFQVLVLTLTAITLMGLFATEMSDPDVWWHLKTGEYLVTHRVLPVPDPFSYTLGGNSDPTTHFNLTHEWLAQVIWYLIYDATGAAGVVLFKALLLTGFCAIAGLIAGRRSGSFALGVAAALTAAALASNFSADRPALLTFFFSAVFVGLLEFRRALWALPVIALVWANAHGGFFMGWVILAAYVAESVMRRAGERRLYLAAGAAVLVSGLNPNHFSALWMPLLYQKSFLTATLIEWRRPYLWGPPYAYDVLLYGAAAVLLLARKRVRPADWILFAAFAGASLMAFRNLMFIALLAPVLIAAYVPWKPRFERMGAVTAALAAAGMMATGIAQGSFYQLRAGEWRYPAGACEFLKQHQITAHIFNTYEYGGYLIWRLWPQQKVFIDGRALSESVYRDYRKVLYNEGAPLVVLGDTARGILDRYGVRVIVINSFEYTSGAVYPIALALGNPSQTDWKLIYRDDQSLVFARDVPPGVRPIPNAAVIDHLERECALHIEKEPEFSLCARTLGFLYLGARDYSRAQRILALYLAHPYAPDPQAVAAYQRAVAGPDQRR